MIYEDIYRRYGAPIARRLRHELSDAELARIIVEELGPFLEKRAEDAHRQYKNLADNPLLDQETRKSKIDSLYNRWRDAEDLAYLIAMAESVYDNLVTVGTK